MERRADGFAIVVHGFDGSPWDYWSRTFQRVAILLFVCIIGSLLVAPGVSRASESQPHKTNPLNDAASKGDIPKLRELLEGDIDPNVANSFGMTPLMFAVAVRSEDGHHGACDPKAVKLLLQHRADIKAKAADGATALIIATRANNSECAQLLIENGADVNVQTREHDTALLAAAAIGDIKLVGLLIQAGAHLNDTDVNGRTPLMRAIAKAPRGSLTQSPYEPIATLLLQAGANVNSRDRNGQTPLTLAAVSDTTVIAYPLLERGADVNAMDPTAAGGTALMIAAEHGNLPLVKALLRYHPELNHRDQFGKTALKYAKDLSRVEIAALLTQAGARE